MMNDIHVGEFRATVLGMTSVHPVRLHGLTKRDYFFFRNPDPRGSGEMCRRYVVKGVDVDNGLYPLSQCREDMEDLQRGENFHFKVLWVWLTVKEVNEERKAREAEEKQRATDESARLKALEAARQEAEEAAARAKELETPGAILPTPDETDEKPKPVLPDETNGQPVPAKPPRTKPGEQPKGLANLPAL